MEAERNKVVANSKPDDGNSWFCTECGAKNTGKFCAECGTKRNTPTQCSKCGFTPVGEIPKFCPECGNKF